MGTGARLTDETTTETVAEPWRGVVSDAREVVTHWREVLYHLDVAPVSSAEAARLRAEMQELREEYARLIAEARRYGRELAGSPPPSTRGDA
jgi:hypothetical protein